MNATEQLPIGQALAELAQSRGFFGLEELAAAVNEATGKDYTVEELGDWPRVGFGTHVDKVLHLTDEEWERLLGAFKERLYQ